MGTIREIVSAMMRAGIVILFVVSIAHDGLTASAPANQSGKLTLEQRRRALQNLLTEHWNYSLQDDPINASEMGDKRWNDKLPDLSLKAWHKRDEKAKEFLVRFEAIDTSGFPEQESLNKELMLLNLRNEVEGEKFKRYLMPINQVWGIHLRIADLPSILTFESAKDYADYCARLKLVPVIFDQLTELLQGGMKESYMPPKFLLEKVVEQVRFIAGMEGSESIFASPLESMPDKFSELQKKQTSENVISAIDNSVNPAYSRLGDFLEKQYIPKGKTEVGIWSLPDGLNYYAWLIRFRTTTVLSPEEIHEMGLNEVNRIGQEMLKLANRMGYPDIPSFNSALKQKKELWAKSPEEIIQRYEKYLSEMGPKLPQLFDRLPKGKLIVVPVEKFREKNAPAAQYEPKALDGSRPARIMVNTYQPEKRSFITMEATAYHEGFPGHHLQASIQQDLPELPPFRKQGAYDAFMEGWALYAEGLGKEVGLYQDPYSDYGRLSEEMLRAIRLVVDTGLHYKKWTREQAINYFTQHSTLDEMEIQSETNRYIAWPAQALAYKVGEMKILALRKKAESSLKHRFDIRSFHDCILGAGALPLSVLDRRFNEWLESQQKLNSKLQ